MYWSRMVSNTREAMVAAAATLLDEGGPAAVTFRAVGERVGLSHNAAFKAFRDKESLLAAVASRELRRQAKSLRRASEIGAEPANELRRLVHGYVHWALSHPARFKLTFGSWSGHSQELAEAASTATASLVEAVKAAQSAGAVKRGDPDRIASMLLAMAHGSADLALNGHVSREGKWGADPGDLLDDLLVLLRPVGE